MATRAQLVERVLRRLHMVPFGQSPRSRETEEAGDLVSEVYPKLQELGIAYWPENSIPDAVMPDLVDYIASYAGGRLVSITLGNQHRAWREIAERGLFRLTEQQDDTDTPIKAGYF